MRLQGFLLPASALMITLAAALWFWSALYRPLPVPSSADFRVTIAANQPFGDVLEDLQREGILRGTLLLNLYARLTGLHRRVQAGEYRLVQGQGGVRLLQRFVSGDRVLYSVTIPDGITLTQMLKILWNAKGLHKKINSPDEISRQLNIEGHPEGLFHPDTYSYTSQDADLDILRIAYRNQQRILAEEWPQREKGLPIKKPYEALILASIIEKETGLASERGRIAGVFTRRLQKGMRLESDPTVIYGIGETFNNNLVRADLRRHTPYNTYTIKGLPPTPIALPGRSAIRAALHPQQGEAIFFVARGDGGHIFTNTYPEHLQAVRRYQLKRMP